MSCGTALSAFVDKKRHCPKKVSVFALYILYEIANINFLFTILKIQQNGNTQFTFLCNLNKYSYHKRKLFEYYAKILGPSLCIATPFYGSV